MIFFYRIDRKGGLCYIMYSMSKRRIVNLFKRQILSGFKSRSLKRKSWIQTLMNSKTGELKIANEVEWGSAQVSSMARMGQSMFLSSK